MVLGARTRESAKNRFCNYCWYTLVDTSGEFKYRRRPPKLYRPTVGFLYIPILLFSTYLNYEYNILSCMLYGILYKVHHPETRVSDLCSNGWKFPIVYKQHNILCNLYDSLGKVYIRHHNSIIVPYIVQNK